MPSFPHEALLYLFQSRPTLAPELLRNALQVKLPAYSEARVESADLTDIQPAAYRADLVVLLLARRGKPVQGVIVEAQMSIDTHKSYSWPAYASNLRARHQVPVCLLVVAASQAVARWAAKPIHTGGGNRFVPQVLGPTAVPVVTDVEQAWRDPELAVFSAVTHGKDSDTRQAARIAHAAHTACLALDTDHARMYGDLVMVSLSKAARQELQNMDPAQYQFQSDFAKRYVALGRLEGRVNLLFRLLEARFGPLDDETRARVAAASIDELDAVGDRLLTAPTLQEALSPLFSASTR